MHFDPVFVHGLAVLSSLGIAGLMSPELVILGLFLAGDHRDPRLKTVAFTAGTVAGLGVIMVAGFFLTPLGLHHTPQPSWHGFFLRVVLGAGLLGVGLIRAREHIKARSILREEVSSGKEGEKDPEIPAFLLKFMPIGERAAALSPLRATMISTLIGVMVGAISPKRLPICMAAGHLLTTFPSLTGRVCGAIVFMALALIPSFMPLALVLVRPAAACAARRGVEALAARYGFWLLALLLILLGLHLLYASLALLPGGGPQG